MHKHLAVFLLTLLAATSLFSQAELQAQQALTLPRTDGLTTPSLVYAPLGTHSGCAPLAVISHGAGGSEDGYRYLAQMMARLGYTTIVMGHRESGMAALRVDIQKYGLLHGVQNLVADPQAEQARLLDIAAVLQWQESQCTPPFRVLLGHSMGAEMVMLEAGQGTGSVSLHRQVPWREMPGRPDGCQWLGVIDRATHMNFAGSGAGADQIEPEITKTVALFLGDVRRAACTLPPSQTGMSLLAK